MTVKTVPFERINGAYRVKTEDGWHIDIKPLMRAFRLLELREGTLFDMGRYWCYPTFEAAALAAMAWDVSKDTAPVGWFRHGGARN